MADNEKTKKKRLHGACDACKRKKIKCDSAEMPENRCTNCSISSIICTHAIPRQPKNEKKKETQQTYIRRLEDRLEKMQRFLQTAYPDQDIDDIIRSTREDDVRGRSLSPPDASIPRYRSLSSLSLASEGSSETDDLALTALAEDLNKLSVKTMEDRFFGQSSGFMLAKETATELTGANTRMLGAHHKRSVFWEIQPWERTLVDSGNPVYTYPESDLLWDLVSLYFEHVNNTLPLLHRPTFEKCLAHGQHVWDPSFGMTVLLVCANASRYSEDPRVFMAGDMTGLSSGWKYFCQVPAYRNTMFVSITIYDLQYYCLAVQYLLGTSLPNAAWSLLGLGARLAIERGIHRRRRYSEKPQAEEELLKRSFWLSTQALRCESSWLTKDARCLVCMDRLGTSFLGRTGLFMDEDFDVDYPIECDDEYWEPHGDSGQGFQQPSGKPSVITAFVCQLKLCEILAETLRSLYSTKKSKIRLGLIGNEWEHRVVADLDSSLNKWKESLPEVLRWDPNQKKDSIFYDQTVRLFSSFFYIQILVHRPFLTKKSELSLVSLAICTNSARSCSHLLGDALTRGLSANPIIHMAAFTSGLIIILNIWGSRKSGLLQNPAKEMANVQICLNVLKECEKRWHAAGRLYDIAKEIGSLNEQPGDQTMRDVPQAASNPAYPEMTTMPPVPVSDPIGAMTGNDWGLNSLLPSQMGTIYANPEFLPPASYDGAWYVNFNNVVSQGWALPSGKGVDFEMIESDQIMSDIIYPNGMVTAEMLSLWSDASATFSGEEWDAYLANISQIK